MNDERMAPYRNHSNYVEFLPNQRAIVCYDHFSECDLVRRGRMIVGVKPRSKILQPEVFL